MAILVDDDVCMLSFFLYIDAFKVIKIQMIQNLRMLVSGRIRILPLGIYHIVTFLSETAVRCAAVFCLPAGRNSNEVK